MLNVAFREGEETNRLANPKIPMLLDWFKLNERDEIANKYLYSEIPLHYTWKENERKWHQRVEVLTFTSVNDSRVATS